MLQKDYWKMKDEKLTELAESYHIPPLSFHDADITGDAEPYFNRDRVINALLVRDNALRTKWTVTISILAFMISLGALVVSIITLASKTATH